MDNSNSIITFIVQPLLISLIIIIYGFHTYWRREAEHRLTINRLRKGMELPQQDSKPQMFKLWTTGTITILLLGCTLGALLLYPKIRIYGDGLLLFAFMSFSIFTILLMIFIRDIKVYLQHR